MWEWLPPDLDMIICTDQRKKQSRGYIHAVRREKCQNSFYMMRPEIIGWAASYKSWRMMVLWCVCVAGCCGCIRGAFCQKSVRHREGWLGWTGSGDFRNTPAGDVSLTGNRPVPECAMQMWQWGPVPDRGIWRQSARTRTGGGRQSCFPGEKCKCGGMVFYVFAVQKSRDWL